MSDSPDAHGSLPIRLAEPNEEGILFRDWLARRTRGDRRATERQLAFVQQWDHLRDEAPSTVNPAAYAARWRVSQATAYRLLEEFRTVFPSEADPGRLLDLLWDGLSPKYLGHGRLGALIDVKVVRKPDAGPRDLRELLPPITTGRLEASAFGPTGIEILPAGTPYQAYEASADRFAWAGCLSGGVAADDGFASFILEGDAEDVWLLAVGSLRGHHEWDQAEMASAAAWARAEGMRLQRVGVRVPTPVFRLAPGARPSTRDLAHEVETLRRAQSGRARKRHADGAEKM